MVKRIFWLLAAAALLGLAVAARVSSSLMAAHGAAGSTFSVSYTGTNYYIPAPTLTGCPRWTWLTRCYTNTSATQFKVSRIWFRTFVAISWDSRTLISGSTSRCRST